MDADGKRLLAVSDMGTWMSADVTYSENGAPTGLASALVGPLLDQQGRPLLDKRDQDAELIALVDGSIERGTLLIGFERRHRIGRAEVRNGHVQAPSDHLQLPPDADRLPPNAGFEAVAVLQAGPLKGSPVAFAERLPGGDGFHTGWIWVAGSPGASCCEIWTASISPMRPVCRTAGCLSWSAISGWAQTAVKTSACASGVCRRASWSWEPALSGIR